MLKIVGLAPELVEPLFSLFEEVHFSGADEQFHPHPFTAAHANELCRYRGSDEYYVMMDDEPRVLAYGMLRGWDEGYEIPSLGIYVSAKARKLGLGKLMMLHLHAAAHLRAAPKIRLKVYKDNHAARHLYEKLGYVFQDASESELIGYFDLSPKRST